MISLSLVSGITHDDMQHQLPTDDLVLKSTLIQQVVDMYKTVCAAYCMSCTDICLKTSKGHKTQSACANLQVLACPHMLVAQSIKIRSEATQI